MTLEVRWNVTIGFCAATSLQHTKIISLYKSVHFGNKFG
jgi:hypothetical protein